MIAEGPLTDIRVLDLGHVVAGPLAGTLLGDLGADVIKVEDPTSGGDTLRRLSPTVNGAPVWWKVAGRNKRSVAIDLRTDPGRDLLLRLVEHADVVIENFRPGTLEKWGLGPDVLDQRNPRVVLLRISGFGQGPLGQGRPGFGRVGEAMSGAANLTGEPDGPPMHVGFSLGDASTGLMGALGVLAALHARDRTGRGDIVDVALFESLFRLIEWQIPFADLLGQVVRRRGNRFPTGYAVAGSYRTRDGRWITVSAATDRGVARLLREAGGDALADDPRFADVAARSEGDRLEQIDTALGEWISSTDATDVIATLDGSDVAVSEVYDAAMMLDDPIFREREAVITVDDAEIGGPIRMPGVVPKLVRGPGRVRWAGPPLGEHTDEVLGELLGLRADELTSLRCLGAIA
jgi:formyl-CoA transferase